VPTAQVADDSAAKPSRLSPSRDGLIKEGLIYSYERGLIAFTVPHFARFLRAQPRVRPMGSWKLSPEYARYPVNPRKP